MIALRRAILMKADPVVSLHANRWFSGRACRGHAKKTPCYRRRGFHFSVVIIKEVDLKLITLTLLALDITTEPSETNLVVTQFDSYKERVKLEAVFFNIYIFFKF